MSRTASNILSIKELPQGRYQLHGYIDGKKIRKRSRDLAALEIEKTVLENAARARKAAALNAERLAATSLSPEQLRDAEAAFQRIGMRSFSLLDCVIEAEKTMAEGSPVAALDALAAWQKYQREDNIFAVTVNGNRNQITAFLARAKVKFLGEISPEHIRGFVMESSLKPYTQCKRGETVRAFLNFCVKQKFLKVSPFDLDMSQKNKFAQRDLAERRQDRRENGVNILTPAQCEKLLACAANEAGGALVPYTILSLWCFMRNAEVQRIKFADIVFEEGKATVTIAPHKRGTAPERYATVPANVAPILRLHIQKIQAIRKKKVTELKTALVTDQIAAGDSMQITKEITELQLLPWSKRAWLNIREAAGLIKAKAAVSSAGYGYKKLVKSHWHENILRKTGESYTRKLFPLADTIAQAGHSNATAKRFYLENVSEADAKKFFAITITPIEISAVQTA